MPRRRAVGRPAPAVAGHRPPARPDPGWPNATKLAARHVVADGGGGSGDDGGAGDPAQQSGHGGLLVGCGFERVERRDERLDGDAAAGDQLATGAPQRDRDGGGPAVLPDQDRRRRAGLEYRRGLAEVLVVDDTRRRALQDAEGRRGGAEVVDLERGDGAVLALGDERDIQDPDDAPGRPGRLAAARPRRLTVSTATQDDVVDRAHLVELRLVAHGCSSPVARRKSAPVPIFCRLRRGDITRAG